MQDFQVVIEMVNGEHRMYELNHTDEMEIIDEFEDNPVWLEIPCDYETHYIQTSKIKNIKIVSKLGELGSRCVRQLVV